ncbi:hypothetical protein X975_07887, partial [Stegodyphus mimosarum]
MLDPLAVSFCSKVHNLHKSSRACSYAVKNIFTNATT